MLAAAVAAAPLPDRLARHLRLGSGAPSVAGATDVPGARAGRDEPALPFGRGACGPAHAALLRGAAAGR
eukprot:6582718-Lingulodinium_polyedra.AAC.1